MPLLPSLLAVLTPTFMVSGITIMSGDLMLTLWSRAPLLRIEGLDREKPCLLFWEGILIGFCALTEYCAIRLSQGKQK